MFHFASGNVRQILNGDYRFKDGQSIEATVLETSVPINPGDSGGPVIDSAGRLVGINSATITGNQVHYSVDVTEIRSFILAGMKERLAVLERRLEENKRQLKESKGEGPDQK